jgi:ferredoxin
MRVWIDQDLCTGDGLCEEICPVIFELHDDGLAYVKGIGQAALLDDKGKTLYAGSNGQVEISTDLESDVKEAAEDCPGECIFIED